MIRFLVSAAALQGLATAPTIAATMPYMSTQERLNNSDTVVIAQAISFGKREAVGSLKFLKSHRIVRLKTLHIVKGEITSEFEFDPLDYVAEWSTDCCVLGQKYLLYLRRDSGGFLPTNGNFSVIKIAVDRKMP